MSRSSDRYFTGNFNSPFLSVITFHSYNFFNKFQSITVIDTFFFFNFPKVSSIDIRIWSRGMMWIFGIIIYYFNIPFNCNSQSPGVLKSQESSSWHKIRAWNTKFSFNGMFFDEKKILHKCPTCPTPDWIGTLLKYNE